MKTSKIFLFFIFACILFYSTTVNAQKIVEKVSTVVTLYDDFDTPHSLTGDGVEVYTLNGNFLRTAHLKIPKDILKLFTFDPYANIWIIGRYKIEIDGIEVIVYDSKIFINKSGNMSVSFHYNGAGRIIPLGY